MLSPNPSLSSSQSSPYDYKKVLDEAGCAAYCRIVTRVTGYHGSVTFLRFIMDPPPRLERRNVQLFDSEGAVIAGTSIY